MLLEQIHYPKTGTNWGLIVTVALMAAALALVIIKVGARNSLELVSSSKEGAPDEKEI